MSSSGPYPCLISKRSWMPQHHREANASVQHEPNEACCSGKHRSSGTHVWPNWTQEGSGLPRNSPVEWIHTIPKCRVKTLSVTMRPESEPHSSSFLCTILRHSVMWPLWRDPMWLSNWLWFLWDSGQRSNALACISFLPSLFHFSFPLAVGIETPKKALAYNLRFGLHFLGNIGWHLVSEEALENRPSVYDSVVVFLTYVKAIGISLLVASEVITLAFSCNNYESSLLWWRETKTKNKKNKQTKPNPPKQETTSSSGRL